jgi:hypothetical protein
VRCGSAFRTRRTRSPSNQTKVDGPRARGAMPHRRHQSTERPIAGLAREVRSPLWRRSIPPCRILTALGSEEGDSSQESRCHNSAITAPAGDRRPPTLPGAGSPWAGLALVAAAAVLEILSKGGYPFFLARVDRLLSSRMSNSMPPRSPVQRLNKHYLAFSDMRLSLSRLRFSTAHNISTRCLHGAGRGSPCPTTRRTSRPIGCTVGS